MLHACQYCGTLPAGQAWASGPDGDTRAIDDMGAQIREARASGNDLRAKLLRIARDRIRVQRDGVREVETGLKRVLSDVLRALIDDLKAAPGNDVPERVQRLGVNAQVLSDILLASLDPVRGQLDDVMAELVILAELQLEAGGIERSPDVTAILAAAERLDDDFWGRRIVQPTAARMWEGLSTAMRGDDLDTVARRIREQSGGSMANAVTEARTQLAEFDRAVTARTAEEAGAEFFAYMGPRDLITRPFCGVLVEHVLTREQVGRLDNAQTVVSPIISGGGYNCRHNWSPIDEVTAEVLGYPMAPPGMVADANAAARRRR